MRILLKEHTHNGIKNNFQIKIVNKYTSVGLLYRDIYTVIPTLVLFRTLLPPSLHLMVFLEIFLKLFVPF